MAIAKYSFYVSLTISVLIRKCNIFVSPSNWNLLSSLNLLTEATTCWAEVPWCSAKFLMPSNITSHKTAQKPPYLFSSGYQVLSPVCSALLFWCGIIQLKKKKQRKKKQLFFKECQPNVRIKHLMRLKLSAQQSQQRIKGRRSTSIEHCITRFLHYHLTKHR